MKREGTSWREGGLAVWVAGWLLCSASLLPAQQGEVPMVDLESDDAAARLVEILAPPTPPPRGLEPTRGGSDLEPDCGFYWEQTRGGSVTSGSVAGVAVRFALNSYRLTPEAERALARLGEAIESARLGVCCFEIEGHTDDTGSAEFNDWLSRRRAETVASYLEVELGIDGQRLIPIGYGQSRPVVPNADEESRSRNRRVQIRNLGYGRPRS